METNSQPFTQFEISQDGLDIRHIFALLKRWLWLVLAVSLLTALAAYFLTARQTPYYRSVTTVLVNTANGDDADYATVIQEDKAIMTYINMMETNPVLAQVQDALDLDMSLGQLKQAIAISTVTDTELIRVTVETTDPQDSAAIANTLVTIFADEIQDIQMDRFSESKASLETQIGTIEEQIEVAEEQNTAIMTPEERQSHDTKLTQYRTIYANLILSYEQLRLSEAQTLSTLVPVEAALPNPSPVRPQPFQTALLAGVVGLLASGGIIFLIDYLDDTIRSPEDVQRKFHLPVLGIIHQFRNEDEKLIAVDKPRSPIAESYRTLRTNVNFSSIDHDLGKLLVSSPEPGEGKTTTVCNLAIVMAQNNKRVIVLDCDLRNPKIHKFFEVSNRLGLSDLLSDTNITLEDVLQPLDIPGLKVITTGGLPPNPAELLGSNKMRNLLEELSKIADVILVDSPPTLAVTDAAVLAPLMDGVLIVAYPGRTHEGALARALSQMAKTQARVLGMVLNNVGAKGNTYGYSYHYYNQYKSYYGSEKAQKNGFLNLF
jgi:non-specific protein-tyrosine kinase